MKLQVLISVMKEQSAVDVIESAHIQTNAIIINQTDKFAYEEKTIHGNTAKMFSFNERGVGLSRNSALMRSDDGIAVFADHDEVFVDGYEKKILDEFKKHPDADMIVFNVDSLNPNRPQYTISSFHRVRFHNCLKYGAARFAIKTSSIKKANIYFSLLFGGGAKYSNGEDSLFISTCVRSGLTVYASPTKIADVRQDESTWFRGYDEKYFRDRGELFRAIHPTLAPLLSVRFILKQRQQIVSAGVDLRQALSWTLRRRG